MLPVSPSKGLVAIAFLGPTASGKSDLAMAWAQRFDCEILCCDSMQVYKGLDIGTGKPTAQDRARTPHHLLDVVTPDQEFHAGAWARQARVLIGEVLSRGRLPLVVGGTGLYFRALTQGLFDAPPADPAIRARHKTEADQQGVPVLHARLATIDPEAAARISPNDLVRTSRALELWEQTGEPITALWKRAQPTQPIRAFRVLYDRDMDDLRRRIDRRVDAMMAAGFLEEVKGLRARGFAQSRAMAGLGYKELSQHLDGHIDLAACVTEIKKSTAYYARRQRTWFRKDAPEVRVFDGVDLDAMALMVEAWLNT
jgi:tRNA dimethylallyltransferase